MKTEYNCAAVFNRVSAEAKRKGISLSALGLKVGLSKNAVAKFQTSMPKADTLAIIADYLNVSVDSLLGRHTAVAAVAPAGNAGQLLSVFNQLSTDRQQDLIAFAETMLALDKKQKPNALNAVLA